VWVHGSGAILLLATWALAIACGTDAHRGVASEQRFAESSASYAAEPERASSERMSDSRMASIASVQRRAGPAYRFAVATARAGARAVNPAQRLSAGVADGALWVRSIGDEPGWSLELRWTGVGRGEEIRRVEPPLGDVEIVANRVTYLRPDGSEEWYLNGPLGIEQGFVLAESPPVATHSETTVPLALELSVSAGLVPVLLLAGEGSKQRRAMVALRKEDGEVVLHYSDLHATDAAGEPLRAWLEVVGSHIVLRVDDATARYPVHIDPIIWTDEQRITPVDGATYDAFGIAVSISGDALLVGAPENDDGGSESGSAYVFTRSAGSWMELQKLTASDAADGDYFGSSVSISGDTALVGATRDDDGGASSGSVYVFVRSGNTWTQQQKLTATDAAAGQGFGVSVSLSGETALIGANGDAENGAGSGAAYVFVRSSNTWTQQQKLTATDAEPSDDFGWAVSLSGDTALVGADGEDGIDLSTGAAYVFVRSGNTWAQQQKLIASDPEKFDSFGEAVSVAGDTALIGAPYKDGVDLSTGAAYVFVRSGDTWTEQQRLTASDGAIDASFGVAVSILGDTALIGASGDNDNGSFSGSAYLFAHSAGTWTEQQKLIANDGAAEDFYGQAVSLSGDTALIGAFDSDAQGEDSGAAYVFAMKLTVGSPCTDAAGCASGHCVDAVCCDTDCSGGVVGDCWSCAVAFGASLDGTCEGLSGTDCDDGVYCNGTETCAAGVCGAPNGDPCSANLGDDDTDCSESCNEAMSDCSAADPNGALCASGGSCLDDVCILAYGASCTADVECETDHCVDGVCCVSADCTPYRCGTVGGCSTSCDSVRDCADGYLCTASQTCEAPKSEPVESEGCGCRLAPTNAGVSRWALLVLLGMVFARRRRSAHVREASRCLRPAHQRRRR